MTALVTHVRITRAKCDLCRRRTLVAQNPRTQTRICAPCCRGLASEIEYAQTQAGNVKAANVGKPSRDVKSLPFVPMRKGVGI